MSSSPTSQVVDSRMVSTRVVTISATYGAGGTLIAPAIAERLGLPFADRLIPVQGRARQSGEAVDSAELASEPRSALSRSLAAWGGGWVIPMPIDVGDLPEEVREQVETSIQELVDTGGAVILGRAAAVVLAGQPHSFHVRLDGPEERRVAHGAAWEKIDLTMAQRHLEASDSARSRYVRRLYRRDPADVSLYHLVLDSTVLPVDVCVELVARAAEAFWAQES
jgi:cytidylate kinase